MQPELEVFPFPLPEKNQLIDEICDFIGRNKKQI